MGKYLLRRMFTLIFVLWGMSLVTFSISNVVPVDPAAAAAGMEGSPEVIERIRKELGLDRPLHEQYLRYMGNILLKGDLGYSILNKRPVLQDIITFLPASIELAVFSLLLCTVCGILLGIFTATRAGGFADALVRVFAVGGVAMPVFWLALLMQLVFYGILGWFPDGGRLGWQFEAPPSMTHLYLADSLLAGQGSVFLDALKHLILPGFTLALANIAIVTRMTRSSLLEVLHQDYIKAARARGLSHLRVLIRHALKNALIPVVTVIGLQLGHLIAWVFLVEIIFSWPGIGSYMVRSIVNLDFPAVMGCTLFTSFIYVFINLAVDVIYLILDPRISY
ncbi:MAG: ABC transporter permease [Deltaproteobacteria bacterium]|jgi:peptide/nickel transport system permease protein|nr:ABC transporter permease [Deltaproteobacteria bacterium]